MLVQDQSEQVKLLVTFPPSINIDEVITLLTERFLFIQSIKRHGKSELLVSFDSMSDLLEIEFVGQFGAVATKVRNSDSFCKEMHEELQSSTDEFQSEKNLEVVGKRVKHFENKNVERRKWNRAEAQKRTSLEDVVCEQEEAIKKLALFDQPAPLCRVEEEKEEITTDTLEGFEGFEEKEEKVEKVEKESIWGHLVSGVVLTSLFVGGVKALKFFMR